MNTTQQQQVVVLLTTNSNSNLSELDKNGGDPDSDGDRLVSAFLLLYDILIPLIVSFGLFGNSMALLLIQSNDTLKCLPSNVYLSALAGFSSLFLVTLLAIWFDRLGVVVNGFYSTNSTGCKLLMYVGHVADCAAVWLIVVTSLDRFLLLYFPEIRAKNCKVRSARKVCLGVLIGSVISQSWILAEAESSDGICQYSKESVRLFLTLESSLTLFIPGLLILGLNGAVIYKIRTYGKLGSVVSAERAKKGKKRKRRRERSGAGAGAAEKGSCPCWWDGGAGWWIVGRKMNGINGHNKGDAVEGRDGASSFGDGDYDDDEDEEEYGGDTLGRSMATSSINNHPTRTTITTTAITLTTTISSHAQTEAEQTTINNGSGGTENNGVIVGSGREIGRGIGAVGGPGPPGGGRFTPREEIVEFISSMPATLRYTRRRSIHLEDILLTKRLLLLTITFLGLNFPSHMYRICLAMNHQAGADRAAVPDSAVLASSTKTSAAGLAALAAATLKTNNNNGHNDHNNGQKQSDSNNMDAAVTAVELMIMQKADSELDKPPNFINKHGVGGEKPAVSFPPSASPGKSSTTKIASRIAAQPAQRSHQDPFHHHQQQQQQRDPQRQHSSPAGILLLNMSTYILFYTHHAILFFVYIFNSPQMRRELKPTALKVLECYCMKNDPNFGHDDENTHFY